MGSPSEADVRFDPAAWTREDVSFTRVAVAVAAGLPAWVPRGHGNQEEGVGVVEEVVRVVRRVVDERIGANVGVGVGVGVGLVIGALGQELLMREYGTD